MRKEILRLCLITIFFLVAGESGPTYGVGAATIRKVPVTVVRAIKRDFSLKLPAMGTIQYVSKVDISSEIPGLLSSVRVEEGDIVKKGQVIATIDRTLLKTRLKQARALEEMAGIALSRSQYEIRKAGFQVNAAKVTMKKQADRLASQKRLFEIGAITRSELDSAEIDYEKAHADYQNTLADFEAMQARSKAGRIQAEAQVEKARADAMEIEERLRKCWITSPMAGIVSAKKKWAGEYVNGGNSVIMTIIDIRSVYAEVDINERDIRLLKLGDHSIVVADAYPERVFRGKVHLISPIVDMNNRTLKVRIMVKNDQLLLKPGMFARVEIATSDFKNAVAVPEQAVVKTGGGRRAVFVVLKGVAFLREVKTGLRKKGWVVIEKGIKTGESVVVKGQMKLHDLSPVEAVEMER